MNDPGLPRTTVPEMLHQRVAASPEATAFCSEQADGGWTPIAWREFKAETQRLAAGLLRHGLAKGDRLALIAPVSLEWELLHHAALSIGVVVVGLDAHDLPARVALMCETADVTAVATTHRGILSALKPERQRRLRFVVLLPVSGGSSDLAAAAVPALTLEQLKQMDGAALTDSTAPPPAPDDTATIIFTSGTTGDPKGIAYSHAQVCLAIDAISDAFPFVGPGSHLLCWLPLSNLFQRMVNLAGMRRGAASFLLGDPRRVMNVVAHVSPDVFIGVPRFYEKLYQGIQARIRALPPAQRWLTQWSWAVARRVTAGQLAGKPTPAALRLAHRLLDRAVLSRVRGVMGARLRCMVTGSAPMPEHLLYEFHAIGWLLLECYGLSENVLPMAMNLVDDFRFGTVGQPLAGNDIRVSEDGSIAVRGPGVLCGYLGATTPVHPMRSEDDYYQTGDTGSIDEAGYLRLQGRNDDVVKTSTGQQIELLAVEAVLRSVEGLADAVVVAQGRKYPVAICTTDRDISNSESMRNLKIDIAENLRSIHPSRRPCAILMINREFSVSTGELTSNLKVRRKIVESRFSKEIDVLYSSDRKIGELSLDFHMHRPKTV